IRRDLDSLPVLTDDQRSSGDAQIAVKELLGEGGMGEVRLARQRPLGRDVAVKSLRKPIPAGADQAIDVLLRESWVTGRLEHPNIVPVHTLGRNADDEPMLVLKNIEGVSWADLLQDPASSPRNFDSDDPLDWHLEILSDVCDAVRFAHSRGIIHRDIKPENVMIGAFGETYLLDWGVAISLEADPESRLPTTADVTSPAGTPAYMAPEMTTADGSALCRQTDIYLLGALLHQIVTGHPPHEGDSVYEVMHNAFTAGPPEYGDNVHPELADVCRRAMQPDPTDRFEDAEAFRQAIAHHRRHRESIQISDEADESLETLRRAIDQDAPDARIYEAFGESRFGFEQALRVSNDNASARRGLQTVLEVMADYELERGSADAAALLVNDLPEPNPELERRLETLEQEIESRERELAELQQMRHEADVDVARHARSVTAITLGLLWGVTIPKFQELASLLGLDPTPAVYLLFAAPVGVGVMIAGYVMKDHVLQNRANRTIAAGFLLIIVSGLFIRLIGAITSLTVPQIVTLEMAIYASNGGLFALTIDSRIWWATLPLFIGVCVAAIFPNWALWTFGGTAMASMGKLAWAWWPDETEA
ncbi:MAG: protein kinase, partial [Bradymonadaceae bacterium]